MTIRMVFTGTSLTYHKSWPGELANLLAPYTNGEPIEVVDRSITGAGSDRLYRNRFAFIDADPSIFVYECPINDAHMAKGISVAAAQNNATAIWRDVRAAKPGVLILSHTTVNHRAWTHTKDNAAGTTTRFNQNMIDGEDDYNQMQRFLALDRTGSAAQQPDWFFDGEAFAWRVSNTYFSADLLHPLPAYWTEKILPRMVAELLNPLIGPRFQDALPLMRRPTTPLPGPWDSDKDAVA